MLTTDCNKRPLKSSTTTTEIVITTAQWVGMVATLGVTVGVAVMVGGLAVGAVMGGA